MDFCGAIPKSDICSDKCPNLDMLKYSTHMAKIGGKWQVYTAQLSMGLWFGLMSPLIIPRCCFLQTERGAWLSLLQVSDDPCQLIILKGIRSSQIIHTFFISDHKTYVYDHIYIYIYIYIKCNYVCLYVCVCVHVKSRRLLRLLLPRNYGYMIYPGDNGDIQ